MEAHHLRGMGPGLRRGDSWWVGWQSRYSGAAVLYYVYIMANRKRGTLYTGVTNDLLRRASEHRDGVLPGFTKTHGCKMLVWFEPHDDIEHAILRE